MTEFVVHSKKGRTEDRMDSSVPTEKQARDLDYCTPERVLAPVRLYCGGQIPLDPFTNEKNTTGALRFYALTAIEAAYSAHWFKKNKGAGLFKYLDRRPVEHEQDFFESFAHRDGLRQPWDAPVVYTNPPYGRPLRACLEKIGFEAYRHVTILGLIPASRFEQGYFQTEVMGKANMICCVRKRLAFTRPSTGEPAKGNPYASLLFGWNVDEERFAESFKDLGRCTRLSEVAIETVSEVETAPGHAY